MYTTGSVKYHSNSDIALITFPRNSAGPVIFHPIPMTDPWDGKVYLPT